MTWNPVAMSPAPAQRYYNFEQVFRGNLHRGIHSIPDCSVLASGQPVGYIFILLTNSLCICQDSSGYHAHFEEQPMTLTKAQIVEALFARNIFTKATSAQIIDTIFELIKRSLQNGEDVLISGFGKFSVKKKLQRTGRNPDTGKPITLPQRKVVTFKCSCVLRTAMNGEVGQGGHIPSPFRTKKNRTDRSR